MGLPCLTEFFGAIYRTFRKDQQTLHGFVTLAILEKLFKKHGSPVPTTCLENIRQGYAVDSDKAAPVLKVRSII